MRFATESSAPSVRWPRALEAVGIALGLVSVLLCAPAHADWEVNASVGAFYGDNLTRAQDAVDKRAAGAGVVNVNATNFIPFTGSDSVTFTVNGRGEAFDRYSGLSNMVVGGAAAYRHKFGVGYLAPWSTLSVGASYDNYRQDLRTSTRLDVRVEAGKRFTEQFDVSAGLTYERRYDNHGDAIVPGIPGNVFDLEGKGAFVRAGFAPTDALGIDVKAGVRRGDVESTAQQSLPIFLASSAIAEDPVWGDPNLYAYRLRGTTWSGALSANYALSDQSSLEFAYNYDFTRAAQGLEYKTNAVTLTFAYRF
jgi:Outer membrane protein beta-barrel domain